MKGDSVPFHGPTARGMLALPGLADHSRASVPLIMFKNQKYRFLHETSGIKVSKPTADSLSWWSESPREPPAREGDGLVNDSIGGNKAVLRHSYPRLERLTRTFAPPGLVGDHTSLPSSDCGACYTGNLEEPFRSPDDLQHQWIRRIPFHIPLSDQRDGLKQTFPHPPKLTQTPSWVSKAKN